MSNLSDFSPQERQGLWDPMIRSQSLSTRQATLGIQTAWTISCPETSNPYPPFPATMPSHWDKKRQLSVKNQRDSPQNCDFRRGKMGKIG